MVILKDQFSTISTLEGCGDLVRPHFGSFPLLEHVVVLKGVVLDNFHFGRMWCLQRTDFVSFFSFSVVMVVFIGLILDSFHFVDNFFFDRCGGLERTDFLQYSLWEDMVFLKKIGFQYFHFSGDLVSLKV